MTSKLLLKDILFNETKVRQIAFEIQSVYPEFDTSGFIQTSIERFPELELKQRIHWISSNLKIFLTPDYRKATQILLASLPPSNDPAQTDNDFGDFIYAPYAQFVATYGCNKPDLRFSLASLKEITQRFSAEDAIRYFINSFPKETMAELLLWSKDSHYHVRRLASEGTRPKLPWAQKILIPIEDSLPILNNLFSDTTRFVTRSVANHLNDISKIDPELVLQTLDTWQKSTKQTKKEMDYIIAHSLRTLIKKGYPPAFAFSQFSSSVEVGVSEITLQKAIRVGEVLSFSFSLTALKNEQVLIDYIISFQNKKGEMNSKKVYKLKKITLYKNQTVVIQKNHPMREHMTTRTLYPGEHKLEIQINGTIFSSKAFEIIRKGE